MLGEILVCTFGAEPTNLAGFSPARWPATLIPAPRPNHPALTWSSETLVSFALMEVLQWREFSLQAEQASSAPMPPTPFLQPVTMSEFWIISRPKFTGHRGGRPII